MTAKQHDLGWERLDAMPEVLTPGPPRRKKTACIPGIGRVHYQGRDLGARRKVVATDDTGCVYAIDLAHWFAWPV